MKDKAKRGFYKKFQKARLEEELHEWLSEEKKKYSTWNKMFKEIKKRYEIQNL